VNAVSNLAKLEKQTSHGGRSLAENIRRTDVMLAEMGHLDVVFGRAETQWARRNLTLSWFSPSHNIRQIAAEIKAKSEALAQARAALREQQSEITLARAEADAARDGTALGDARAGKHLAVAEKHETSALLSARYIDGALRDIATLHAAYQGLVAQYGEVTEARFEAEEQAANLARVFSQALRDLRSAGRISNGNQEYLEQCGVNVAEALRDCTQYLDFEQKNPGVTGLFDFLRAVGEHYADRGREVNRLRGLPDQTCAAALWEGE
jgi:hypothetical protein